MSWRVRVNEALLVAIEPGWWKSVCDRLEAELTNPDGTAAQSWGTFMDDERRLVIWGEGRVPFLLLDLLPEQAEIESSPPELGVVE